MAGLSVIIPANNEAAEISGCLSSLLGSNPKPGYGSGSIPVPMPIEVIVVANGCTDETAGIAAQFAPKFEAMGWDFSVIELAKGSKPAALNAGDAAARHSARAYLDADVRLGAPLLDKLARVLQSEKPIYASGRCVIAPATSWASRAYARIYSKVPFMNSGVPGCGLFGVSSAGRRRWRAFPEIISDDTFVRLNFSPRERLLLNGSYTWPVVEGFRSLVKVRARQNKGVDEVYALYPELEENEGKEKLSLRAIIGMALSDPVGFAVYAGVAVMVRFRKDDGWSRGR